MIVNAKRRKPSVSSERTTFPPEFYTSKRESLSLARSDTGFHSGVPSVDYDLKSTSTD